MLDKGKIIYDGSLTRLRTEWGGGKKVHLEMEKEVQLLDLEARTDGLAVSWEQRSPRQYTAHLQNGETVSEVLTRLVQHVPIQEMQIEEASTEEIVRKIYQDGMMNHA
jgi:ABC-2 type transport system ATP-binding protein